jgi:hypothetical protein
MASRLLLLTELSWVVPTCFPGCLMELHVALGDRHCEGVANSGSYS